MSLLSLILTTYNSEENLQTTLDSIEKQDYPNIEIVIKDGGSTDRTLDIIERYANASKFAVKYISKLDTGIYDAMNQGIKLSTGNVIGCFNDRFVSNDSVSKMMSLLDDKEVCGVHADLVYATENKVVRYWHMGSQKSLLFGWMPGHPTLFLKKEIYNKYGLYKTDYKISADYEFMIRFLKDKENRLAYLPETVISMYYGGTSTNSGSSYIQSLKEGHRALVNNGIHPAFFADVMRTMRVLSQFIIKRNQI